MVKHITLSVNATNPKDKHIYVSKTIVGDDLRCQLKQRGLRQVYTFETDNPTKVRHNLFNKLGRDKSKSTDTNISRTKCTNMKLAQRTTEEIINSYGYEQTNGQQTDHYDTNEPQQTMNNFWSYLKNNWFL